MNYVKRLGSFFCLLILIALFSGCAAEQVQTRRFFWPQLPERPRLEWLNAYSSQLDFPKTGLQKFMAAVAGEEEAITFSKPVGIASDSKGKVYVADPGIPGIFVFDLKNFEQHMFGREAAIGQFKAPISVAIDSAGQFYVSDSDKGGILVFDQNENPRSFIDTKEHTVRNGDVAIDQKRGRLLVVDTRGHRVSVYDLTGKFLFNIGERGEDDGKFNYPVAVVVNHQGEVIVADAMNARIQIFDSEGKFLRKFGTRGDGPSDFQIIKGVAVDSDDNIYVTEGKGHKLIIFSARGEYLMTVGGLYSSLTTGKLAPGGFVIPQGLCIDDNDVLYVVDQLNKRFQVFQYISDKFLKEHPIDGWPAGGLPAK